MPNISIGRDSITNTEFLIDSTKHISVEGMSGMGKSTLLVNLFIEHIRQGNGGLFIDPHGDTADQIAKLIPKSRMRDFIWIDPDASLVPPFNPLHFNSPEELELGKESLFTTFKSLAGSAWGDESARVIINAIDAVCEYYDQPTLRDARVRRWLRRPGGRGILLTSLTCRPGRSASLGSRPGTLLQAAVPRGFRTGGK
jgi:hypothetical protein